MDTRDTPEQAELRRTARRLARELGPRTVADLDDRKRGERLADAVRDAGWLELRQDGGDGDPLASGVEAAIIADALGEAVADVPFAGPILAADLARRAGARPIDGAVVAFAPDLIDAAVVSGPATDTPIFAVDGAAQGPVAAYVLVPEDDGYRLALVDGRGRARRRRPHARDPTTPGRRCPCARSRPVAAAHARRSRGVGGARPGAHQRRPGRAHAGRARRHGDLRHRIGGSTASPSERSRPCSTSSPRRAV